MNYKYNNMNPIIRSIVSRPYGMVYNLWFIQIFHFIYLSSSSWYSFSGPRGLKFIPELASFGDGGRCDGGDGGRCDGRVECDDIGISLGELGNDCLLPRSSCEDDDPEPEARNDCEVDACDDGLLPRSSCEDDDPEPDAVNDREVDACDGWTDGGDLACCDVEASSSEIVLRCFLGME